MPNPTLKKGSKSPNVTGLQESLSANGYDTGGVDGIFGAKTEAAVKRMQKDHGLKADGIVGPATWARILHWSL